MPTVLIYKITHTYPYYIFKSAVNYKPFKSNNEFFLRKLKPTMAINTKALTFKISNHELPQSNLQILINFLIQLSSQESSKIASKMSLNAVKILKYYKPICTSCSKSNKCFGHKTAGIKVFYIKVQLLSIITGVQGNLDNNK